MKYHNPNSKRKTAKLPERKLKKKKSKQKVLLTNKQESDRPTSFLSSELGAE